MTRSRRGKINHYKEGIMPGTNSINGDAKVILLRLKNLEESQRAGFERVEKKIDDISDKFHGVDKQASENKTRIENACHDIVTLEGKSNKNDALAGIGAFVAAVLGAIGIAK